MVAKLKPIRTKPIKTQLKRIRTSDQIETHKNDCAPGGGGTPPGQNANIFFRGGAFPVIKPKHTFREKGPPPGGLPGEYQNQWPMVDNALQLTNFNLNHVPVNPRHEIETRANQWPMVDNMLQLPNNLNHERVNPTYKNHMTRNGSMHEAMTSGFLQVLGMCSALVFFLFCGVLNATGDSFDGTYYQNI